MDPPAAGADNQRGQPVLAGAASSSVQSVRNWIQLAAPLTVGRGEAGAQSLKKVLKTGTLIGSEEDASEDLKHFKELLKSKLQERVAAAVDDLPSLLAGSVLTISELVPIITECAAATEANLSERNKLRLEEVPIFEEIEKIQQDPQETSIQAETGEYDILGTGRRKRCYLDGLSILAEMGWPEIVLNAVSDGSHFVCAQCGGVISNSRKKHHLEVWCGVPKLEKSNIGGTSMKAETKEYHPLQTTFPDNLQQILKDIQGTETGKSNIEGTSIISERKKSDPHGTSIGTMTNGECDPLQETGKRNIEGTSIISEKKKIDPRGISIISGTKKSGECDPLQETGKSNVEGTSIISETKKSNPQSDSQGASIVSETEESGYTEMRKYDILRSNFSQSNILNSMKDFMARYMVTEENSLDCKPDGSEPERSLYQIVLDSILKGILFQCPKCRCLISTLYIGYQMGVKPQIKLDAVSNGTKFLCPACESQICVRREDDKLVLWC